MSKSFIVVIPARFASTRLPGKILADIHGKTMIEHVYRRALSSQAQRVLIATDHHDIEKVAKQFGAEVVMTSVEHLSGTDRLQEVCSRCEFAEDEIVVNIQGDEPLMPPAVINQVAERLSEDQQAGVATLCETIDSMAVFKDPNVVKVVMDNQRRALYFSRAPIPWPRDEFAAGTGDVAHLRQAPLRHLGIYAYRVSLLNRFVRWPAASLEQLEKLEQLRLLVNGENIVLDIACETVPAGVDTEADLERVRGILSK